MFDMIRATFSQLREVVKLQQTRYFRPEVLNLLGCRDWQTGIEWSHRVGGG